MRTLAALMTVLCIVPAALAIKPAHPGPSVEETLRLINEHLAVPPDYSNIQCSDRIEISLTNDRAEIVIQYRMIDKKGAFRDDLPPRFIYRIPVASVKTAYIWGPWTAHDRVIIRTYRRDVVKAGPLWDCWHNRVKEVPRERVFDNADIKLRGATDEKLYRVADEFKHMVELLQAGQPAVHPATDAPEATPKPDGDSAIDERAPEKD